MKRKPVKIKGEIHIVKADEEDLLTQGDAGRHET